MSCLWYFQCILLDKKTAFFFPCSFLVLSVILALPRKFLLLPSVFISVHLMFNVLSYMHLFFFVLFFLTSSKTQFLVLVSSVHSMAFADLRRMKLHTVRVPIRVSRFTGQCVGVMADLISVNVFFKETLVGYVRVSLSSTAGFVVSLFVFSPFISVVVFLPNLT